MADEIRRSGRATKGQHNAKEKDEETAGSKKKGKATKMSKRKNNNDPEPEDDEGEDEDENIRCICGTYDPDEERNMIGCEKCGAWQHNDCMGLPGDYDPPKYFCEQCKPSDHKELIAAVKRGEKPWEEVARAREEAEADKKKGKKGGKKGAAGRKSGGRASEAARTPTLEPEEASVASKKRKHEESPAPLQIGRAKKARASVQDDSEADGTAETPAATDETPDSAMTGVAKDAKEIDDPTRSKIAAGLIKSFVEQATGLTSKGVLSLTKGESAKSLGTSVALHIEQAIYTLRSGGEGEPNEAYKEQIRAILNNIKYNAGLAADLLKSTLSARDLAMMDPKDMASEEQKQKDADEKTRMEKQHVLTEEKGPRIRRTHKGDEYIDDSHQVAESATSNAPLRSQPLADQDADMKSPTMTGGSDKPQVMRKPSAAAKGKLFGDPRRKSSSNFDIDKVWSGVQGSPTDGEAPKLPRVTSTISQGQVAAGTAGADPEVDRLLKDEENENENESEPYSPREFVEEGVVWRGRVNGASLGTFNTIAKFAAGCQPEAENLRMTWSDIIPSELKLHGRIHPSKADEYLCGLEYSSTTELIIVSILEPKDSVEQKEFNKFFDYLRSRDRYGVGTQHSDPAIKDIYLLPMEKGQPLPTVMEKLEHTFTDPVQERSFLVPIVIKWTELPHNADRVRQSSVQQQAAQSPSTGPPIAQTPITPHEPQIGQFEPVPYAQQNQQTQPTNGTIQAQTQAQSTPTAHAPTQAPIPQTPAATNALRILGQEMANFPAVVSLIAQAPNAGESEFNIIKECIEENAEAGKSLGVLTASLQQKYHTQRSAKEQQASTAAEQSPVVAQT